MRKLIAATFTPLASIFGSGFLVIAPVLNGAVGPYSLFAMAAVCFLAYCVGDVIRFNIAHAEPLLQTDQAREQTWFLEHSSDLALIAAYVVSVCLYINILASFLLRGLGMDTPTNEHIVSVAVIGFISVFGYTKGLEDLEKLEDFALWVTLLIIGVLLVGFARFDAHAVVSGTIQWPKMPDHSWWEILTIVGGTLIVVQGFETSRYLSEEFDATTRIQSCRLSQIISTIVYLVFIALATPLMHFLSAKVQGNALIVLAGKASHLLPIPLVVAAVFSQFSAAVADTIGGGGNIVEVSKNHVDSRHAYLILSGGAAILAFAPTLTILALASRAFAFYYMLQCFVAITVCKSPIRRLFFSIVAGVLAFITFFTVPAG